jgi:hypothetical protein
MEPVAGRLRRWRRGRRHLVTRPTSPADAVKAAEAVGRHRLVVLAAGQLGDQDHLPAIRRRAELITTNFAGPASTPLHVAQRLREQGHGRIVVLTLRL